MAFESTRRDVGIVPTAPAFWNNPTVRSIAYQVVLVGGVIAVGAYLIHNTLVNLERPVRPDGRFGGHFVQGHVDGIGHVEVLRADADFHWLTVSFPSPLAPYLVLKGSIAVDGVSLTVARLGVDRFDAMVLP